jgi:hypothetical protein
VTTFISSEGYQSLIAVWRNGVFIEVMAVTLADFFYRGLIWLFLAAVYPEETPTFSSAIYRAP